MMGGAASKRRRCLIGPVGRWASLPLDLLLEIFCRLESTAVIRCAAVCRPWRRAIIGNASFLRPRPDRFLPSLLLGVFHGIGHSHGVLLRRTAGPLQSALPVNVAGNRDWEPAQSFIPAAAADDRSRHNYGTVLSSRDGFILLGGDSSRDLCLCNPMAGDCTFVPIATIRNCTYILLTGYDLSLPTTIGSDDDYLAVRILAIDGWDNIWSKENRITYQLLSFTSGGSGAGVWGPVRRSVEMQHEFWLVAGNRSTVVCRDVVHWLGGVTWDDRQSASTVALDVHTGRTWITDLPERISVDDLGSTLLATTGDGQLSLIWLLAGHELRVWVLDGGGGQWSLQQTVNVQKQLPQCCREGYFTHPILNAFCPRSGCVLAVFLAGQEIRIDLESGHWPRVECIGKSKGYHCKPYEMDWSTYISKMKRF